MRVYGHQSAQLLVSRTLFKSQAIHGFAGLELHTASSIVLAWGGRSIRTFEIRQVRVNNGDDEAIEIHEICSLDILDWILDVGFDKSWSQNAQHTYGTGDGISAALVTAHNALSRIWFEAKCPGQTTHKAPNHSAIKPRGDEDVSSATNCHVESLTPGSRTMFYSAHLVWLSSTKILTASGTAFGDVIVWSFNTDEGAGTVRTHFDFPAHEGSVFGVRISEPLYMSPDEPALRLLASCSDDRSIRIWDITDFSGCSANPDLDQFGDTGFRTHTGELDRTAPCTEAKYLATAMGHVSRIWSVQFLPPPTPRSEERDPIRFVSIGEDAICQLWQLTSSSNENTYDSYSYNVDLLTTAIIHSGKNIWAVSLLGHTLEGFHDLGFVTGGGDAGISAYAAKHLARKRQESKYLEWSLGDVCYESTACTGPSQTQIQSSNKLQSDIVRSYAFLGDGDFVYTTNNGALISSKYCPTDPINEHKPEGKCVGMFPDLKGSSITTSLPRLSLAFFAGAGGLIRAYDRAAGVVVPVIQVERKVTKLFAQEIKIDEASQQNSIVLVVTFLGLHRQKFIFIEHQPTRRSPISISSASDFEIPTVRKEITAVHTAFQERRATHFIGTRNGHITALRITAPGQPILVKSTRSSDTEVIAVLEHAHGKEAVTSMRWIANTTTFGGWLFSTGRDGFLVVHHFDETFSKSTLVHRLSVPLGQNLEGLHVDLKCRELLLYGFRSTKFILYDVLAAQEIMSTQCGGAHRTWAFNLHRSADTERITGGTLLWTKASKPNLHSVTEPPNLTFRSGFHGREVKVCAIASTGLPGSGLAPLIATGAEDTDIRLLLYSNDSGPPGVEHDLRCVAILRMHNTGIQSLKWSNDGSYLFSSGGFEEFFVWKVTATPVLMVGVICESTLPIGAGSDLRISDFAIKELNGSGKAFSITVVYSNSTIKTFRYSTTDTKNRWTLMGQSHYTTSCLTVVNLLEFEELPLTVTAATDGHIALWKQPDHGGAMLGPVKSRMDFNQPLRCIRIHQSAVKCLSVMRLSPTVALVLSGSDDNSIGITLLQHHNEGESPFPILSSTLIMPRAHAASVTASAILRLSEFSETASQDCRQLRLRAVTSSNDQRIKVWHITVDSSASGIDGISVEKAGNVHTAVADVSSMAVFAIDSEGPPVGVCRKILVCGVGMEVWSMMV